MKKELKQAENAKIDGKNGGGAVAVRKAVVRRSPSTYAKYVHTVRSHILPHLGEMSVAEINTGYRNIPAADAFTRGRSGWHGRAGSDGP
ncbi:MAG: hypothetical protein V8Q40_11940 [Anaerosacchariphilus sp.]